MFTRLLTESSAGSSCWKGGGEEAGEVRAVGAEPGRAKVGKTWEVVQPIYTAVTSPIGIAWPNKNSTGNSLCSVPAISEQ